MPAIDGIAVRISANTSRGCAYVQSSPSRFAISTMIARSGRASPGGCQRLPPELHQPVGVGEGAGLFGKRGRGQDHVGEIRGLGEEDVLHDQHLELRERRARVAHVGIRHRRVLAHHVHATDLARVNGVHDLDDGEAGLGVE